MDPVFLERVARELDSMLSGGVVSKVQQPSERDVVLVVFSGGRERRVLLLAGPTAPRAHLTERRFENPPRPLRFCALLRKRIKGARVEGVRAREGERIAEVRLARKKDSGFENLTLVVELTGKSANLILVDGRGVVIDALRHFPSGSEREVYPGMELKPLPSARPGSGRLPERLEGESWNEAADRVFGEVSEEEAFELEKGVLRRAVRKALKKEKRKLENLKKDGEKAARDIDAHRCGDMILAGMHNLRRGMDRAMLTDYTIDPPHEVEVPLDPRLGPKENAERYFKRTKKAKRAMKMLEERVPRVERRVEYLEGLLYQIDAAEGMEDLAAVREEVVGEGLLKEARGPVKRAPEKRKVGATGGGGGPVREYRTADGFKLLCGKSGRGNDMIVRELASGEDIWFHAQGAPGSHVLIKVAGRGGEVTDRTIEEAAALAAWHSRLRSEKKAEVIYAEARDVRKPKGAKPGMVTVKEYSSITVEPGEPGEDGE